MTSHEYYQCTKEKMRYIETGARKLHLSAMILSLIVK